MHLNTHTYMSELHKMKQDIHWVKLYHYVKWLIMVQILPLCPIKTGSEGLCFRDRSLTFKCCCCMLRI